jgi:hypothetical protein
MRAATLPLECSESAISVFLGSLGVCEHPAGAGRIHP